MIKPIFIEFQNFLSFGEKLQTFHYCTQGIHYIYGINHDADINHNDFTADSYNLGVGKSSLALALEYALYGDIQRKVNKDQIVNKTTKKNLYVGLVFEVTSANEKYQIKRYRKHDDFKNKLQLLKWDGKTWNDISGIDLTQTQEFIDKIIVLDIRTFEKVSLLTREDKFQFLEMPILNRGMIFENISQINKFRDYWTKAKNRFKLFEDALVDIDNKILKETTIIKRDKKYIEEIKEQDDEKRDELQNEIDDLQIELDEVISTNISATDILNNIIEFKKLVLQSKTQTKAISESHKYSEVYLQEEKSLEKDVQFFKDHITDDTNKIDNFKPKKCHNCGAVQDEQQYQDELNVLLQHREYLEQRLARKQTLLAEVVEKKNKAIVDYLYLEKLQIQTSAEMAKTQLPEFIKKAILNDDEHAINNIKNLDSEIKTKKSILASIDSGATIAQLETEIKDHLNTLKIYVKKKNANLKQQEIYQFWLNVLDFKSENSLKQFVITQIIPLFNNFVQQMIDVVYKGNLLISFDNFFDETIYYQGEEWKYDELSTGEKMKLNFCINLAIFDLTRVNMDSCGVIFFDEIFTNADAPTIIACLDIIRDRYAKNNGVYIISHDEKVKDNLKPNSTILIEKREKISEITEISTFTGE